jgi:hypothetical protein
MSKKQHKGCEIGSKRNNCEDIKQLTKVQQMLMTMASKQQMILNVMEEKFEKLEGTDLASNLWKPGPRAKGGRRTRHRRRKKRTRRRKSRRRMRGKRKGKSRRKKRR